MLKGYHAAFDNIKYTANNWLPGTSPEGKLDGSVRTSFEFFLKDIGT